MKSASPRGIKEVTTRQPDGIFTIEVLWFWNRRFDATDESVSEFVRIRMPPFSERKRNCMRIDRHFLRRAKASLIEFTAFVSLLLVLAKIIITEAHQLFR